MRKRLVTALLVVGFLLGSLVAANYAAETKPKRPRWEYLVLRHSPGLKQSGSDMKKIQEMGSEGWELASSYPSRGEIIYTIFKRTK